MSLTVAQIQAAYVVFFNRPADPAGLAFWQSWSTQPGNDLANLHRAFALSPEYASHFEGIGPRDQVSLVYRNLLGREPDLGGLNYWSNELATGRITVATLAHHISWSAQNPIIHADPAIQLLANQDRATVANRITAATSFTNLMK